MGNDFMRMKTERNGAFGVSNGRELTLSRIQDN